MADTYFVFQFRVPNTGAPQSEAATAQLAKQLAKSLANTLGAHDGAITVVDAFNDTAETTISEV
jgi:phenylpyruvate tautomerase PptA (4-oxalocrotonate tautomerase family)